MCKCLTISKPEFSFLLPSFSFFSFFLSLFLSSFPFSFFPPLSLPPFHQLLPTIIYHFHLSIYGRQTSHQYLFSFTSRHLEHIHTHPPSPPPSLPHWGEVMTCSFQQKHWRAGDSVPSCLLPADSVNVMPQLTRVPEWRHSGAQPLWTFCAWEICCCVRPVRLGGYLLLNSLSPD